MWMMGCSDGGGGDQINLADSLINDRKLRHLLPRPSPNPVSTNNNTTTPYFTNFTHLLGGGTDQCKRELNTQAAVVVNSRWNPTPEQLHILEELYRRGTRTPSTDHIQHITAQLRRYGKIEGKNVFYWFQNHKARERQKRRRQLQSTPTNLGDLQQPDNMDRKSEFSSSGANRTGIEVEQSRTWGAYSTTFPEKKGVRDEAAGGRIRENRGGGMEKRGLSERNGTWQRTGCSSSSTSSSTVSIHSPPRAAAINSSRRVVKRTMEADDSLITPTLFLGPHYYSHNSLNQTLDLFPLGRTTNTDQVKQIANNNNNVEFTSNTTTSAPCQYFEFLPLKN